MLKELHIKNIILVESAQLIFQSGFHVFSGETGSGKTAILKALELILGKRCDTQVIRNGCEKASVEALFELPSKKAVYSILNHAGIDIEEHEDLLIKREISTLGKSRVFINNQMAQLSLLKQIAHNLIEIVAQHASQKLFETSFHKELLDRFGGHLDLVEEIKQTFTKLQSLKKEFKKLVEREEEEKKLKDHWQQSFDEIENANILLPNEEEALFEEYEKLSRTKELYDALSKTYFLLQDEDPNILSILKASSNELSKINVKSSDFNQIQDEFRVLTDNLSELSFSILKYRDSLEENPERLFEIDERLKLFRSLCKSYGPTLNDVIQAREHFSNHLENFEEISSEKNMIQSQIEETTSQLQKLSSILTHKREQAKIGLEQKIQNLFNELNLHNAKLSVVMTPTDLSETGQENVEFFLRANKGEKETALKEGVSGGELSRVLLALKVILSELEEVSTLIFDEIDANLGGETAPKIGALLKKMSYKKQIFTITHLPQVAVFATHHYQIYKKEEANRTYSLIQILDKKQKEKEIERMLGGKSILGNSNLANDLLNNNQV